MGNKIRVALCGYVDGKHESQVQFSLGFPNMVHQAAQANNLNLECGLISLVGCDEMSRKQDIHSSLNLFHLQQIAEYDAIFDRMGTMVPSAGIYLDSAVYSGAQVFNRPISLDESKARDYMLAALCGFNVPKTVVLPQASYIRAKMIPDSDRIGWDVDLDEAVRLVGGYPCFLKKANGGGRAHVYRIKNKAELFEEYQMTREMVMILQAAVDIEKYVRTFCFGDRVIHTFYDIDQPDGQKYSWPDARLTEEERMYLDKVIPMLTRELLTPFCTMEIAKDRRDGQWYFIDITNGCNFDMREGELTKPIFSVVSQTLIDKLLDLSCNPMPMIVHTHLQEYVLRQQLCRGYLKKQNVENLFRYAQNRSIHLDMKELEDEAARFADAYTKLYG